MISRRGSYFRITFLFEILRFAQYDGTWDNTKLHSSPWERLGEGLIFSFNVNSLSSPYVVGGPKSLISRRGSYFGITFLIEILRFAKYDGTWDNTKLHSSPWERLGEGLIFSFNVNSLSSPYVVGGQKSLISRRESYFRITFLIEILRFAQYDKYNRGFGGKAPAI